MAAIGILMLLLCVLSIALMSPPEVPSWHGARAELLLTTVVAIGLSGRSIHDLGTGRQLSAHIVRTAPEIIAAFENDPNTQETDFFDGGHPDAAGYPIGAERVYRKLQELRWLSRPAS